MCGYPVVRAGIESTSMSLVRTNGLSARPYGPRGAVRGLLRASYPAVPSALSPARHAIAACAAEAGASDEQIDAIRLASSEALTNIVRYAYRAQTGFIYVTARVVGGELWVLIADNGCGIRAGADSDGLGLGLALISQLTDGFSVVQRSTGGTELRLRFVLGEHDIG